MSLLSGLIAIRFIPLGLGLGKVLLGILGYPTIAHITVLQFILSKNE